MKIKNYFLVFLIVTLPRFCLSQELFLTSEAASSEAKNRKYLTINTDFISQGQSYTPYLGLMYGINGRLTFMGKMYYSRNTSEKFLGDIDIGTNYRFYSDDKKQFHYRMSLMTHIRIPAAGTQHSFASSMKILPPSNDNYTNDFASLILTSEYRTDNWTPYIGFAATLLKRKFAVNLQLNYAVPIPQGDYKFGNYFMSGVAFGYLLFPKEYKGYSDINFNLYFEPKAYYFSGNKFERTTLAGSGGWKGEFTTGAQLIFASTSLLELGYTRSIAEDNIRIEKNVFFTSFKLLFF